MNLRASERYIQIDIIEGTCTYYFTETKCTTTVCFYKAFLYCANMYTQMRHNLLCVNETIQHIENYIYLKINKSTKFNFHSNVPYISTTFYFMAAEQ